MQHFHASRLPGVLTTFIAALALFVLGAKPAEADGPRQIAFQGLLASGTGVAKAPGPYTVTFRIYTAATGGTAVWTEVQNVTVATRGVFAAALGSVTALPASLTFDAPYFLSVQVSGEAAEMTPRIPLLAAPYALGLSLPVSETTSTGIGIAGLKVANTGDGYGLLGDSRASSGVFGISGSGSGVHGESASSSGVDGKSGTGHAVTAISAGTGVGGAALYAASAGNGIGLLVDTNSTDANVALFQGGTGDIIKGVTNGGSLVRFNIDHNGLLNTIGGVNATVANNYGVIGHGTGTGFAGIYGLSDQNGVYGQTYNGSATAMLGRNESTGNGVFGYSVGGTGVAGRTDGDNMSAISGYTEKSNGNGVFGFNNNISTGNGVYGVSNGVGSFGVLGISNGVNGAGLRGAAGNGTNAKGVYGTSGTGAGVFGHTDAAQGYGVYGENGVSGANGFLGGSLSTTDGDYSGPFGVGIAGFTGTGAHSIGVYGTDRGAAGSFSHAGLFDGDVEVLGTLYSPNKMFKIDHPLDPSGQYLVHACVESSQRLDMYAGHVTLDASGQATVQMPAWFDALNRDCEYHLTAVGAPGPNLYIAEEVVDNHFKVAGGSPGGKVSWEVTGVRKDAYANAHPLEVEVKKVGIERGTYLFPELFGQPPEKKIYHGLLPSQAH